MLRRVPGRQEGKKGPVGPTARLRLAEKRKQLPYKTRTSRLHLCMHTNTLVSQHTTRCDPGRTTSVSYSQQLLSISTGNSGYTRNTSFPKDDTCRSRHSRNLYAHSNRGGIVAPQTGRQLISSITLTSAGSPDPPFYSWFDLLEKGNLSSSQEVPPQPLFP